MRSKIGESYPMRDVKTYPMEISSPWANLIFCGTKKIEMRKNDPKGWGRVRTGDYLSINKKGCPYTVRFQVIDVRTYPNLHMSFMAEGVRNLLPGLTTKQEGFDVYLGFDGSSKEAKEKRLEDFSKFGTVVIELVADPASVSETIVLNKAKLKESHRIYKSTLDSLLSNIPSKDTAKESSKEKEKDEKISDDSIKFNKPNGDPLCNHTWDCGYPAGDFNDETISFYATWNWHCRRCGLVTK